MNGFRMATHCSAGMARANAVAHSSAAWFTYNHTQCPNDFFQHISVFTVFIVVTWCDEPGEIESYLDN